MFGGKSTAVNDFMSPSVSGIWKSKSTGGTGMTTDLENAERILCQNLEAKAARLRRVADEIEVPGAD